MTPILQLSSLRLWRDLAECYTTASWQGLYSHIGPSPCSQGQLCLAPEAKDLHFIICIFKNHAKKEKIGRERHIFFSFGNNSNNNNSTFHLKHLRSASIFQSISFSHLVSMIVLQDKYYFQIQLQR